MACWTLLLGDDLPRPAHQTFEYQPFARGQFDLGLIDEEPPPGEVDAHAIELDHTVERTARAPHESPTAGDELGRLERLAQKIVGADIERLDLVGERAARRENQRRQGLAGAAQAAHERQTVRARQPDVDDGEREFLARDRRLSGLGADDSMHGKIRRRQATRDGVGDDIVVFNDQEPHDRSTACGARHYSSPTAPPSKSLAGSRAAANGARRGGANARNLAS